MSETTKANTVAFHTKAVFEGDVENAFRSYGGAPYRQHNPLIEDGMEGLRKFIARMKANRPGAAEQDRQKDHRSALVGAPLLWPAGSTHGAPKQGRARWLNQKRLHDGLLKNAIARFTHESPPMRA